MLGHPCDVTDENAVGHLVDRARSAYGRLDVPLRRWAAPGELAGAALLLTDPQSGYITGTVLPVDGGWTSH